MDSTTNCPTCSAVMRCIDESVCYGHGEYGDEWWCPKCGTLANGHHGIRPFDGPVWVPTDCIRAAPVAPLGVAEAAKTVLTSPYPDMTDEEALILARWVTGLTPPAAGPKEPCDAQ